MALPKPWLPVATALALLLVGALRLTVAQSAEEQGAVTDKPSAASDADAAPPSTSDKPAASEVALAPEQAKLAGKYKELERVVLRMAEVMQSTDPKRAALLRQAFAQSKERQIDSQFEDLVKLLQQDQLYQATKGQAGVQQDLNRMLQLLMSGDRDKQIPNERAEIKRFIERINKLIREQQGIRGETEGQGDAEDLTKRQDKIADKAVELARDLNKFDDRNNPDAGEKADGKDGTPGKDGENINGDQKSDDQKGGDQKGDGKSDSKSSSKKSDGKKSDGKSGDKSGKSADRKSDGNADEKSDDAGDEKSDAKSGEKSDSKSGKKGADGKKADGKSAEGKKSDGKSDGEADGDRSDGNPEGKSGDKSGGKKSSGKKSNSKSGKKSDGGKSDKSGDKADKSDKADDKSGKDEKSDDQKSDDQKSEDQKSDGKSPNGQKSNGKSGQKSDNKSSKSQKGGKSSKGQPQDQPDDEQNDAQNNQNNPPSDQQDDSPARKRVRQAEERMREAKRKLEDAQRRGAAQEQERAIEELKQAKAALEEILRQLREEEIERVLAMLEGRFRKMLQLEAEVYEGTIGLDRIPEEERDRDLEIESGKLSRKQASVSAEAEKALMLLREEGSSVAFPESVEQMREDMDQVTARLARANVGQITQGVEQDIVKSLEEMVAALQKAQKDQQQNRGAQQGGKKKGGGGGQPQDKPLVNAIAELKMIRALQMRVNTRTKRYSDLLQEGAEQAEQPDLIEALKRLAEREDRVHKTTHDIEIGKNR